MRAIECSLSHGAHLFDPTEVHVGGRHPPEPTVVVLVVVAVKEWTAPAAAMLEASESTGEVGCVLGRLELSFGEGVVVGDVGPVEALGDAEVGGE